MHSHSILKLLILFCFFSFISASLIASSEIQFCQRTSNSFEPLLDNGEKCQRKFVVALTVRNGQGKSSAIYADIRTVENVTSTGARRRENLRRPFRIFVTKSEVFVHYPVRYLTSVNNRPFEQSYRVRNTILGISSCRGRHCRSLRGYCCKSSRDEKLSRAWEYKRGVGRKVNHYYSHKYSRAICMGLDKLWYNVFTIQDPYLTYKINVTVQQLNYQRYNNSGHKVDVWSTVGNAEIGPERIGQNTAGTQPGVSSTPSIIATWQGDFSVNTYFANFNSKYLMTPEWRVSSTPAETKMDPQVQAGSEKWLIVDRHLVDSSGTVCNKIGSDFIAFDTQENKCFQETDSCFQVTPKAIFLEANRTMRNNLPTHYFPSFYGDFRGPHIQDDSDLVMLNDDSPENSSDFQLIYKSRQIHNSLVTLVFTAETISFVENRSNGRIVEAMINDFTSLAGSGFLEVIVQNTGRITSDYLVSVRRCTEGIIRVSQQVQTINPMQQAIFIFELSSSLNLDSNHTCYVELNDQDARLLDMKQIDFKTKEGCIYCPAGQCVCECEKLTDSEKKEKEAECKEAEQEYLNPFWEPRIIVIEPCYHCWITNSLKNPVFLIFSVVMSLLSIGMAKMLITQSCCVDKYGRPVDVVAIILGTTSAEHKKRKQRSTTIQFLLGACFFVYLPLLPLMIIFCNWRRRRWAKKQLKRKAMKQKQRALRRKEAELKATQGLLVLGEEGDLTLNDALTTLEKNEKRTNRAAVLVVSSSSASEDTDEQDFDYSSQSSSSSELLTDSTDASYHSSD